MNVQPTFQGEVMLLGWSETHSGGAKVTFLLPDPDSLEPFKTMTVAKGKTAGQRLALVAVEIGDDEQPVNPAIAVDILAENNAKLREQKGGELAKLAGMFCQQPEFWRFAGNARNSFVAAQWIRDVCRVESRSELDHNPEAAHIFHERIRKPYAEARK